MNILFKKHIFRNLIGITIGSMIFGIAYSWFLIPYKIAPGGLGGLSQIFFHFFHIPAGLTMLVLNIPLFIIAVKFIGKQFGLGSIYGIIASAFFTDLFAVKNIYNLGIMKNVLLKYNSGKPFTEWAMTDTDILAALAGSILLGIAVGIIFRFRGSTGGTDIPAAMVRKYLNSSMTVAYMIIDTGIIFTIGIVFQNPNIVIWGLFNLFIMSKVCDITMEGLPYVKGVFIISNKPHEIKKQILEILERGVTVLHGEGGYYGEEKKVIMTAINRRQMTALRELVKEIDPKAFVILNDVSDIMGYGFKSRYLDMGDTP